MKVWTNKRENNQVAGIDQKDFLIVSVSEG